MCAQRLLCLCAILIVALQGYAQPAQPLVQVIVSPDRADWTYEKGEQAKFKICVLKNKVPIEGIDVAYSIGPEMMTPWEEKSVTLKTGEVTVETKKFSAPGFVRCTASAMVDGKIYSSYATAGVSPDEIEPTTTLPNGFLEFWQKAKEDLARVPIHPVLTLLPERCTYKVDVYHVRLDNIAGNIYGILCKPKAKGKYPAILHVPGAGIRPYHGDTWDAEKGIITFQIGIHGIPVNLPQEVYDNLRSGALDSYWVSNLDDKDKYYYKRVYLGCVRAVDFIESLEDFNGEDIAVTGESQGGALSIVLAALDNRIDYLAAIHPALSDLTGFLHGRAGGWPHMFRDDFTNKPDKIETSKYYDVVNFARFLKVPGWYSWGYNDNVCPPTSMFSAYNLINAPKELHLFQETQHWTFPEQQGQRYDWLAEKLSK